MVPDRRRSHMPRISVRANWCSLALLACCLLPCALTRPSAALHPHPSSKTSSSNDSSRQGTQGSLSSQIQIRQRHLTALPRHPGRHQPRNLQDGLRANFEPQLNSRASSQHAADRANDLPNLATLSESDALTAASDADLTRLSLSQNSVGNQQDQAGLSQGERLSQVVYDVQSAALNQPQHASIGHHLIAQADEGGDEVLHGEHRHLASAEPVLPEAGAQLSTTPDERASVENLQEADLASMQPEQSSADSPIRLVACAQLKNEVPYVVEWIEFHRLVGFSHLVIYDDYSTDNIGLLETLYRYGGPPGSMPCDLITWH